MKLIMQDEGGIWVDSPKNKKTGKPLWEGAEFLVRSLTPQEESQIRRDTTVHRGVMKDDGTEEIIKIEDEVMQGWLRFRYMLLDWKGVTDEDEGELPCNDDTKMVFFSQKPLETQAIIARYTTIKYEEYVKEEKTLKNSVASSSSESTTQRSIAEAVNPIG